MDISAAFPSKFLKASDLNGKSYKLAIKEVLMEDMGGDHQPVLYFQNTDKGVVLNKTNMNAIASVHGYETTVWAGKQVEVYPTTTMFKGQTVPCIRLSCVAPPAAAGALPGQPAPAAAPLVLAAGSLDNDLNDAIPF